MPGPQQYGDRVRGRLRHAQQQDPGIGRDLPEPGGVPRVGEEPGMAADRAVEGRRRRRRVVAGGEDREPGRQGPPVVQDQPVAAGRPARGEGARPDVAEGRTGGVVLDMREELRFDVAPEFPAPHVDAAVGGPRLGVARRAALPGIPVGQVVRRVRVDEMHRQRRVEPVVRVGGVVGDAAAEAVARLDDRDLEPPFGHARKMDREGRAREPAADHGDVDLRHPGRSGPAIPSCPAARSRVRETRPGARSGPFRPPRTAGRPRRCATGAPRAPSP